MKTRFILVQLGILLWLVFNSIHPCWAQDMQYKTAVYYDGASTGIKAKFIVTITMQVSDNQPLLLKLIERIHEVDFEGVYFDGYYYDATELSVTAADKIRKQLLQEKNIKFEYSVYRNELEYWRGSGIPGYANSEESEWYNSIKESKASIRNVKIVDFKVDIDQQIKNEIEKIDAGDKDNFKLSELKTICTSVSNHIADEDDEYIYERKIMKAADVSISDPIWKRKRRIQKLFDIYHDEYFLCGLPDREGKYSILKLAINVLFSDFIGNIGYSGDTGSSPLLVVMKEQIVPAFSIIPDPLFRTSAV